MEQNILQATPARLLSLDFFRGLTVAAMLLVNNPGSWDHIYAPLAHAPWHGCTPTDLIFPFFLFIVGVSIVFALSGKKAQPALHGSTILRVFKRSLIIFGIGLFLALFPDFDFSTLRIPGVLQRIAVVFLISAILYLKTSFRTQVWVGGGLLVLYYILLTFVPVPGIGPANLEPATNLGAWLDNTLLTGHLWASSKVWDPEGLLSTMPAVVTGLAGVLTGQWLRTSHDAPTRITWLFVWGNLALLAGLIWNGWFPLNKALWTSSFVLFTAGLAMNSLALCYWLIDVRGHKKGTKPFVAFGTNAITAYIIAGLLPDLLNLIKVTGPAGQPMGIRRFVHETIFAAHLSPKAASLASGLLFVLICFIPIWILYKRRIYIKI